MKIINAEIPQVLITNIEKFKICNKENAQLCNVYENCLLNTYQTTLFKQEDQSVFVITGDIPAMWNRDSVGQVKYLLKFATDSQDIKNMLKGVIIRNIKHINRDPYANAHNLTPMIGSHSADDIPKPDPFVWEQKFELDSLCFPIELIYKYWVTTEDESIFNFEMLQMFRVIIDTLKVEQHHEGSKYTFRRIADWLLFDEPERIKFETLPNHGKGKQVRDTGLVWSGFRPSDDACEYGYNIPGNMYAAVILRYINEMLTTYYPAEIKLVEDCKRLEQDIRTGIETYGVVEHSEYGKLYAYEVDGRGNALLIDDSCIPNLLSAPYIGYCNSEDEIYKNTRKFILSKKNPYYYENSKYSGVGSSHSLPNFIWPMAMMIDALTSEDLKIKKRILQQLISTETGDGLMHESFNIDDPNQYTRPWFSWANSLFVELVFDIQTTQNSIEIL